MKNLVRVSHWVAYGYLIYAFGYASLFKVFQKQSMMDNMSNFGFGKIWTLFIGYGELLGVIGLVVGLWRHQVKNLSTLWLFPFAIGALITHFAHHDYEYFYTALYCCVASMVLLATDKNFKIIL
ncbi:MAG: DoxX family protein [Muricauda sp.]|nr:DoxX family protein [Allomuricauda sp.]MBO6588678.1 DoxX family protein [Allomuricauda sp.]MBO6618183.1 DoxX family protein [Allomuricauda sp.]MBO6644216.1 DoxX family protein [Allomuricauda sp.]MBO6747793.1 DoxX family protein [Allomuricauda sp.]MBO6844480.1 DoxX family protein [Allomuricauda sp.]